ncbi:unnamed protein product, partial [marine sediment metagenome]
VEYYVDGIPYSIDNSSPYTCDYSGEGAVTIIVRPFYAGSDLDIIPTEAAIYYVRTDGDNGNDGLTNSSGGAWETIDYAASTAEAGNTVYVNDGTYNETVVVDNTGTSDNRIVFEAINHKQAILDAPTPSTGTAFTLTGKDYITITGFVITDYDIGITLTGGSDYNVIDSCKIYNNETHQVNIYDGSDYNTVRADSIFGSALGESGDRRGEVGVRVYNSSYNLIEYCTIYNMFDDYANGDGIGFFQDSDYNIARYNTIHHCPDDGLDGWSTESSGNNGSYNLAEYNYVYKIGYDEDDAENLGGNGVGMKTNYETDNFIMRYNRVRQCVTKGISDEDSDGDNTFYHNVTWNNGNNWEIGAGDNPDLLNNVSCGVNNSSGYFGTKGNVNQTNLTTAEAYFVDTTDFELADDSPLIDAGNFLTACNGGSTGTSITLDSAKYFIDGYGLITGDQIQIA